MNRRTAFLAILAVVALGVAAADWPHYLGPNRNATSPETGLARTWPEGGPEVLWSFPLGEGFGGPVVSQGKVYVADRISGEKDVLRCIDLATGKEEWNFAYDAPGKQSHPGSRSLPSVDGDLIFFTGGFGHLHCVDKNTHQAVWSKHLSDDFGTHVHPAILHEGHL
jgi:outer membrane protein assembly factor BamB